MSLPENVRIVTDNFIADVEWTEYLIFGAVLASSLAIGLWYGCFGNKNKTNEEFLMAGRSMPILPVTLSLVCSFVSAVTLLGNPVEVYFYGQVYNWFVLTFIPLTAALAYLYVPVYFELQLTSAYEYMEWRFSRSVRTMCSLFAITHMIFYMPITTLGPSLAIDQVTGFDWRLSSAAIFLVCIAYSSLGGLKAVLWTDALQAVVMIGSLLALCVCGTIEVGGIGTAWERSQEGGRINPWIFDVDPRTRHTAFTGTIGGYLMWMPMFAATQSQIQRYNSVPTLRHSRQCLLFNMVGMMLVILICSYLGFLIFAWYEGCDPLNAKIISSPDQLLPLFVGDALRNYPLLPGLLISGITCGSLSSVSSALNSFTALVTEDFVKRIWPHWDDVKYGVASKIISTGIGLLAFSLVFVVRIANEAMQISQFSTLIHGALLGPILGAFSLGMFFPWANNLGNLLGMISGILIAGTIGVGNIVEGTLNHLPNLRLDLTLRDCPCINEVNNISGNCSSFVDPENLAMLDLPYDSEWKNRGDSFFLKAFSTSYIWGPGIGCVATVAFGALFSFMIILLNKDKTRQKVHIKLLSKPVVRMWNKILGEARMEEWIDYDEKVFYGKQKETADKDKKLVDLNTYSSNTIPRAKLASPYSEDST